MINIIFIMQTVGKKSSVKMDKELIKMSFYFYVSIRTLEKTEK